MLPQKSVFKTDLSRLAMGIEFRSSRIDCYRVPLTQAERSWTDYEEAEFSTGRICLR